LEIYICTCCRAERRWTSWWGRMVWGRWSGATPSAASALESAPICPASRWRKFCAGRVAGAGLGPRRRLGGRHAAGGGDRGAANKQHTVLAGSPPPRLGRSCTRREGRRARPAGHPPPSRPRPLRPRQRRLVAPARTLGSFAKNATTTRAMRAHNTASGPSPLILSSLLFSRPNPKLGLSAFSGGPVSRNSAVAARCAASRERFAFRSRSVL
jgi:hypothetical protein